MIWCCRSDPINFSMSYSQIADLTLTLCFSKIGPLANSPTNQLSVSRLQVNSSHGELVTGAQKRDSELVTRANAAIRLNIHSCIVIALAHPRFKLWVSVHPLPLHSLLPSPPHFPPSLHPSHFVPYPFPPFP